VRKKRVGCYEYHQLVENHWVEGRPRQKVLLHFGRYPTVQAALEGWPKEIDGLRRFARNQRQRSERLSRDRSSGKTVESPSERARKAETLADEIAAKLEKLQEIEEQGKI
jgi:hypothetical protein